MADFETIEIPELAARITTAKRKEEIHEINSTYSVTIFETGEGKIYVTDSYAIPKNLAVEKDTWEEAMTFGNSFIIPPPPPVIPLSDNDIARWGVADLRDEAREKLEELLASGKDFDTGWAGSTKEFDSLRIITEGETITVMVHEEMDDLPDLIWDATPDVDAKLMTDALHEQLIEEMEMDITTETETKKELPRNADIDMVISAISECLSITHKILQENYEVCKEMVRGALHRSDVPTQ